MHLTILGCNGPFPAPGGATSGYLVVSGDTALMLDIGAGTLANLTAFTAPEGLTALVLSHWHYDHCSDILPLTYRLAGGEPLHVYAPVDENSPIRAIVAASPCFVLHDLHAGDTVLLGGVTLTAFEARHPVPALMYRLTGEGRTLCYTGDTNTVPGLTDFARGADLLLADGLFTQAAWAEGKPHLSAAQVAEIARDAAVGQVVITHLNPAIDPETLLKEARALRIDSRLARIRDQYDI